MMKYLLFIFLISLNVFSYVPTAESLFRFPSLLNTNDGNYRSLVFTIEGDQKEDPRLYRLSYHQDQRYASKPVYISQMMYLGTSAKDEALLNLKQFSNFSIRSFGARSRDVVPVFLYSLMQGMLWHDGKFVLDALKNFQFSLSYNRELINQDYAKLLRDYKKYSAEEKEGAENLGVSPLAPTNPQDRAKLNEVMKKGLLSSTNQVRRELENTRFAFYVREDSFEAKFWEDNRELAWIKFVFEDKKYQITFDDYLSFKGKYRFPQTINFILPEKQVKLKVQNLWVREESWGSFTRRKSEEVTQNNNLGKKEPFPQTLL